MLPRARVRTVSLAVLFMAAAVGVPGATYTVIQTGDGGSGSLRQAILDANANPGNDDIAFAIPGNGVQTIQLASPLPDIVDPVYIDGYTQPGASPNSNPPGQGFNTVIEVEVKGTASPDAPCFTVKAGNSDTIGMVIRGLAINRCSSAIFVTNGGDYAQIRGNFIGTDAFGTVGQVSLNGGIRVAGATGVLIAANLVSGTHSSGISLGSGAPGGAPDATVVGNLVGTSAAGDVAVPNAGYGIDFLPDCGSTVIGGPTADARNVVSGNSSGIVGQCATIQIVGNYVGTDVTGTRPLGNSHDGLILGLGLVQGNVIAANDIGIEEICEVCSLQVYGNFIGTDATATLDLGNLSDGIDGLIAGQLTVGGPGPGQGNVIAHNGHQYSPTLHDGGGIFVTGPLTTIRGNRIFDNWPLGIDLYSNLPGVTPNDPGDEDISLYGLTFQNFPVITAVVPGASSTHIEGTLNSMPSQVFDVDLFASPACPRHPWDYLQAETYLGSLQAATDTFGNASFAADVPVVLAPGQPVTATATDPFGNTSEFSQRIVFALEPRSGAASGGATATVSGMAFETGAAVTVDGVPASNVVALDPLTITATMPGFAPGTLHPVTVSVPSGLSNTLPDGWLADFTDVPSANLFHDAVAHLVTNGVAAGIGGGNYGVNNATLRQQMAVFLLKGRHGPCYVPPPCAGLFGDVPCPSPFADWIEELAAEGITGGCGGGQYCPASPVRRDQMAAFLLKAEHGSGYGPPACAGLFPDVQCPSLFADWIEQLAGEQITGGCGGGNYCPASNATRGQMAAFVVKTFLLP